MVGMGRDENVDAAPFPLEALMDDVARTLVAVFDFDADEARAKVLEYMMDTKALGAETWLLSLHFEPIQVAADLAGVSDRPLNDAELARYAAFQRRDSSERPSGRRRETMLFR